MLQPSRVVRRTPNDSGFVSNPASGAYMREYIVYKAELGASFMTRRHHLLDWQLPPSFPYHGFGSCRRKSVRVSFTSEAKSDILLTPESYN